jgi:hypothetical protein
MAENTTATRTTRYRGRIEQIGFFFVKLLRMFVYQNDWKLLPMAVIIAGLVSLVVRNDFFVTMEGTLKGALALSCVSIWNGCFNSVQVVCRERDIIKREHRSGMHISSYIISHMLYQALLCFAQSALTIFICMRVGIKFPQKGFMTPFMVLDVGITVFLISYASDMIALWISCIVHNTTTAMSVMPFLLITQLVFSGGIFTLPSWSDGLSKLMISNYGVKCIAAQADYNNLPMATAWNTVLKLKDTPVTVTFTVEQVVTMLGEDNPDETIRDIRSWKFSDTTKNLMDFVLPSEDAETFKAMVDSMGPQYTEMTFGNAVDSFRNSKGYEENKDRSFTLNITVWKLIEMAGEEKIKGFLQNDAAFTQMKPYYAMTKGNIAGYWFAFVAFIVLFGALSIITLEFVDKDKR